MDEKWFIVRTGRRSHDPWVAVHFGRRRFCFDGNMRYLHTADRLELASLDEREHENGVVLFSGEWKGVYVLMRRPFWGPDDYFIQAARILGERGIIDP